MPSSSTTRWAGDSRPSAGATPQIRKSGHVAGVGDGLARATPAPGCRSAMPSRKLPGVDAGPEAVDDAEDLVALGVADQPVGGLAVLLPELALAVHDGGAPGGGGGHGIAPGRAERDLFRRGHRHGAPQCSPEEATGPRRPSRAAASGASAPNVDKLPTCSTYQRGARNRRVFDRFRCGSSARPGPETVRRPVRLRWGGGRRSSGARGGPPGTRRTATSPGSCPARWCSPSRRPRRQRPHCWLLRGASGPSLVGSSRSALVRSGTWCSSGSWLRRGVAVATVDRSGRSVPAKSGVP